MPALFSRRYLGHQPEQRGRKRLPENFNFSLLRMRALFPRQHSDLFIKDSINNFHFKFSQKHQRGNFSVSLKALSFVQMKCTIGALSHVPVRWFFKTDIDCINNTREQQTAEFAALFMREWGSFSAPILRLSINIWYVRSHTVLRMHERTDESSSTLELIEARRA